MEDEKREVCEWQECGNNKDWFYCPCIDSNVNIWKHCRKRGITPVQLFRKCSYCGRKIKLGDKI